MTKNKLTYNTKLIFNNDVDKALFVNMFIDYNFAFNVCSNVKFKNKIPNSIKDLHKVFYKDFREENPNIQSFLAVAAMRECLSASRSTKSNNHRIKKAIRKKNFSIRLNSQTFSLRKDNLFNPITMVSPKKGKRLKANFVRYPKLMDLMDKYKFGDPLVFLKGKAKEPWLSLTFNIPIDAPKPLKDNLALGVDLGIRRTFATSEGYIFIDKKFNGEKRKLRFLKRELQSCGTKSARKHLSKIRSKERNKNKNQTHKIANLILGLACKANIIVLEDLSKIKRKKKNKQYQNKNMISQVPFFGLREVLEYKAAFSKKMIKIVNPAYTSQINFKTKKIDGIRKGIRYYTDVPGVVFDADVNAAMFIAERSKHPVSLGNKIAPLDGQVALISQPNNVCKSKILNKISITNSFSC